MSQRFSTGNRISCLIENLHSDKKQESDDEEEELERDTEEELKLGRLYWTESFVYNIPSLIIRTQKNDGDSEHF